MLTLIDLAADLTERLERLGVDYVIGGSLAAALVGEPRSTADIDIAVELGIADLSRVLADVAESFYVPEESARRAVDSKSSFNLIPYDSALKVDLFVLGDSVLDRRQIERRQSVVLPSDPPRSVWVTSPEDVILRKLRWFLDGGGISDRQWRDILGVLRIQAGRLDDDYLDQTAAEAGLTEQLDQSRRDVGV